VYPLPRATIWRLAAPTRALHTFTAYAWYQLATNKRARALTFGAKLVYLAVAHHADHATASGGYHGSTAADLAEFVGIPAADLRRPLRRLIRIGWLDGDPAGPYTPPSTARTFIGAGQRNDPTRVTCARCLTDLPAEDAIHAGDDLICDHCQTVPPAHQPDTRKE
jgi:hypothetical protein